MLDNSRSWDRLAWVALASASLILALNMGLRQSLGLFLQPMIHTLHWTAGEFALAIAVQQILWGLTQPLAGAVADKFGTARVLASGGLLFLAGFVLMSTAEAVGQCYLGVGVLMGIAASATGFPIVFGAVTRRVPPSWSTLSLVIVTMAGSFGQFAIVPTAQFLTRLYDWSAALIVLGLLAFLITPLAPPLKGPTEIEADGGSSASLTGAINEAFGHSTFWCINAGFFTCGFHFAFLATHLPGLVATCQFPTSVGANMLSLIGLANIAGAYGAGLLAGRWPKKLVLSATYFLRAFGIAVFLTVPWTEVTLYAFAIVIGFLWLGTVPMTSALVGHIYGTRYLATLYGIVFLSHQVGAFFGAWLGGLVFDATGVYTLMLVVDMFLALLAAALHLPIREHSLQAELASRKCS
ncbi:MFS transporter [Bradyrhizobium sp. CCGUVB1N3]|uniref:MFS transporter n=1 Tax=Bradyrhizobium sp. CCGUVB1N3 TaxID=2949629 RepID=UPI0020B3749D|nr:MFS transporter [Bradyrhizobium sp. CCGUVB1N3]MCP3472395.1 MFS transporter [Bradyrhizobium sp. CCGUVB1N3]